MNTAREKEERKRVRSEKRNGKISLCSGVCTRVGTKFRALSCIVLIVMVEVAVVMLAVVVVSTGSGPPPTLDSPSLSLSSIRSSSLHLSSTRPAHSSLLLHSSLFFSLRVLCISSAFSRFSLDNPFVLPSCISFSSFSCSFSAFFSLSSFSYSHFILFLVFFHFVIYPPVSN